MTILTTTKTLIGTLKYMVKVEQQAKKRRNFALQGSSSYIF